MPDAALVDGGGGKVRGGDKHSVGGRDGLAGEFEIGIGGGLSGGADGGRGGGDGGAIGNGVDVDGKTCRWFGCGGLSLGSGGGGC